MFSAILGDGFKSAFTKKREDHERDFNLARGPYKGRFGGNELGSAHFVGNDGSAYEKILKRNLIIGKDGKEFIEVEPKRHLVTVAPTRSGKGVSLIIPNLLHYEGSCLVIDPKGENAYITAKRRREMGQKVYILDPWGEVNRRYGDKTASYYKKIVKSPDQDGWREKDQLLIENCPCEKEATATFNPLSIIDPESPHYTDDIAYISDALIINQGKEPFFDDSARELVAGLIAYVAETYKEGVATLPLVRRLLNKNAEELAGLVEEAKQQLGLESLAVQKLGRFAVKSKENGNIISTAQTQTAFLDSTTLQKNMMQSSFSFEALTEEKATIYLVLPVDKLQSYGRWLRLIISLGIRAVARNTNNLPAPVLFFLDEFGTVGRLSVVAQAFGLMAGLGMRMWIFIQDLGQLKRDYPEDWETFIANCGCFTGFDTMDRTTTDYLSHMLGNKTVEKISTSTSTSFSETIGSWPASGSRSSSTSTSVQVFARNLLTSDEIRTLKEDKGLALRREGSLLFDRCCYFIDRPFRDFARQDPYFEPYNDFVKEKKPLKPNKPFRHNGPRKRTPEEERQFVIMSNSLISLMLFLLYGMGAGLWLFFYGLGWGFLELEQPLVKGFFVVMVILSFFGLLWEVWSSAELDKETRKIMDSHFDSLEKEWQSEFEQRQEKIASFLDKLNRDKAKKSPLSC